jgi:hypothetical protein
MAFVAVEAGMWGQAENAPLKSWKYSKLFDET